MRNENYLHLWEKHCIRCEEEFSSPVRNETEKREGDALHQPVVKLNWRKESNEEEEESEWTISSSRAKGQDKKNKKKKTTVIPWLVYKRQDIIRQQSSSPSDSDSKVPSGQTSSSSSLLLLIPSYHLLEFKSFFSFGSFLFTLSQQQELRPAFLLILQWFLFWCLSLSLLLSHSFSLVSHTHQLDSLTIICFGRVFFNSFGSSSFLPFFSLLFCRCPVFFFHPQSLCNHSQGKKEEGQKWDILCRQQGWKGILCLFILLSLKLSLVVSTFISTAANTLLKKSSST